MMLAQPILGDRSFEMLGALIIEPSSSAPGAHAMAMFRERGLVGPDGRVTRMGAAAFDYEVHRRRAVGSRRER